MIAPSVLLMKVWDGAARFTFRGLRPGSTDLRRDRQTPFRHRLEIMLASPRTANSSPTAAGPPRAAIETMSSRAESIFEPPDNIVVAAIARNKLLVCAAAVIVAVLAAVYGHSRPSTYTAATTLQVGQVNPNSPGFYSYVESAAALASAFSRAISAEPVLSTVQHTLELAPATAVSRLSAEPLPQSPAFRVFATGPTATAAMALANVASRAIIAYETTSNSANPQAEALLREYDTVALQLQHATSHLAGLERLHPTARKSASEFSSIIAPAEAERETAATKLAAIRVSYTAAVSSEAPRAGLVSLIAGATSASNNRKAKAEMLGFIGLLVGFVTGSTVAVVRETHRRKRTRGAEVEMVEPAPDGALPTEPA
jgi:uncharacterized protein involved in exopolysaccharide biosynthesis